MLMKVSFRSGTLVIAEPWKKLKKTKKKTWKVEAWTMRKNVYVQTAEPLDLGFVWVRRTPGATLRVRSQLLSPLLIFFCGRRPLPFGGSHLRLPSRLAGICPTTSSLSALARPTPYQLSRRVASIKLQTLTLDRENQPC